MSNRLHGETDDRRYLISIDGKEEWLPGDEARIALTREEVEVELGGFVMRSVGSARELMPQEVAELRSSPEPEAA